MYILTFPCFTFSLHVLTLHISSFFFFFFFEVNSEFDFNISLIKIRLRSIRQSPMKSICELFPLFISSIQVDYFYHHSSSFEGAIPQVSPVGSNSSYYHNSTAARAAAMHTYRSSHGKFIIHFYFIFLLRIKAFFFVKLLL